MNRTRQILSLILTLLVFTSCTKENDNQKTVWKGKIEYEKGIKVIKNPQEPLYGIIKLKLEEDLSIGGTGDNEQFTFYKNVPFAIDEKENIYIGDTGNCGIQKFSKQGRYLQTIGRKGKGPGEFMNIQSFYLGRDGSFIVYDPNKIHLLDKEGNYEQSFQIPFSSNITSLRETQDGCYLMLVSDFINTRAPVNRILTMSLHDGTSSTKTIETFPHPYSNKLIRNNLDFIVNMKFSPNMYFCRLDDRLSVFGYSSELKLSVIGPAGETEYIIEKEEICNPINKEDKKAGIERDLKIINMFSKKSGVRFTKRDVEKASRFQKCRPVFSNILPDGNGNIYVIKFKSITDNNKGIECDLFSKEGYYLYNVVIPQISSETMKIRKDFIYMLDEDSDSGYICLKRYKIKNWDQLKEYNPKDN